MIVSVLTQKDNPSEIMRNSGAAHYMVLVAWYLSMGSKG